MFNKTRAEVYRSFAKDSNIRAFRHPQSKADRHEKRMHRTNLWPGDRLNYDYLNRCKETVCRAEHPTGYFQHKKAEYRVSILPWSRGAYLDLRVYKYGASTPTGILLHLDVISAILPDIISAVRRMENEDTREDDQKAKIRVIHA